MISRRSFLLGIGSLVTSSFVARARAHVRERGSPLLLQPKKAEETLYHYEGYDQNDGPWATKYRVSLGPDQWPAPPPPTWREHLKSRGYRLETREDHDRICDEQSLTPEELDQPIDGYDVLTRENWEAANLREIVRQAIEPFLTFGEHRLHCEGSEVRLPPRMALQELATNATKYGALSNSEGEVHLTWSISRDDDPARLRLIWKEVGGPRVSAPTRQGFGSRLIERSLAHDLNGTVKIEYDPEGVICTVDAPLT